MDGIVAVIKGLGYLAWFGILMVLIGLTFGTIMSITMTSWWYMIPCAITLVWVLGKWCLLVIEGYDPEHLSVFFLLKVMITYVLGAVAFALFTSALSGWISIPLGLIFSALALLCVFGAFDTYMPGVHPDELSQGPGIRD